ncbi:hypothetical protein Krac_4075 [Ktedonobacter racemifer DSM 44963]|uniref:Uncharacterized protein n=1 Tax=Ktedonobacter racemifer DSM 44963 TaxID=485913 RepID=D6TXU3_KTERA|nr:hypothetical protein Krac_4075 [Ktedonobacter racemifer DSM 44963]
MGIVNLSKIVEIKQKKQTPKWGWRPFSDRVF